MIETYPTVFKNQQTGAVKPVIIKGVDGGPDENPRFEKNILMGSKLFQELGVDCLIEVTNAPGLSAYNLVERRMFHLRKELTGIVLPADTFGSHIKNNKTIDEELEKKNFKAAGEILSQIWSNLVIDGEPVQTQFVEKSASDDTLQFKVPQLFFNRHVLETQYQTVYLKCDDRSCCKPYKTVVEMFFPNRRIPALIPIKKTEYGPVASSPESSSDHIQFLSVAERVMLESKVVPNTLVAKYGNNVPYDVYLPTVKDDIDRRVCKHCSKYHSTIKSLTKHKRLCKKSLKTPQPKKRKTDDFIDDDHQEVAIATDDDDDDNQEEYFRGFTDQEIQAARPLYSVAGESVDRIMVLKEWLKSPWATDD
jgi:hypothetical protein